MNLIWCKDPIHSDNKEVHLDIWLLTLLVAQDIALVYNSNTYKYICTVEVKNHVSNVIDLDKMRSKLKLVI